MENGQTGLMLLQSSIFILTWVLFHQHISHTGPKPGASVVTKYNSRVYSFASLVLLALILSPSHEGLSRSLFHTSKFYEYVDIFNVLASGGKISLHFGFHHSTTPWFTFIRVLNHSEGWKWFASFNAFHHFLMYAYFGGWSYVRPILPWTGTLQLVVGIAADIALIMRKRETSLEPTWPNVFSGVILGTYLVLSTRELLQGAKDVEKHKTKSS
ncbi:hypothetical protein GQ53DRAFT_747510 [Thozetella sp. PMI_491]|nr:hypothetical protein GQ53DRAFT_747510 [Thozetella sp. PMI_491]